MRIVVGQLRAVQKISRILVEIYMRRKEKSFR